MTISVVSKVFFPYSVSFGLMLCLESPNNLVPVSDYFGVWCQVDHFSKPFYQNKISILGHSRNNRTSSQNYPQNILVFGGLSRRSEHIFTDLVPWTLDTLHVSVRFLSVTGYKSYPSAPCEAWVQCLWTWLESFIQGCYIVHKRAWILATDKWIFFR